MCLKRYCLVLLLISPALMSMTFEECEDQLTKSNSLVNGLLGIIDGKNNPLFKSEEPHYGYFDPEKNKISVYGHDRKRLWSRMIRDIPGDKKLKGPLIFSKKIPEGIATSGIIPDLDAAVHDVICVDVYADVDADVDADADVDIENQEDSNPTATMCCVFEPEYHGRVLQRVTPLVAPISGKETAL